MTVVAALFGEDGSPLHPTSALAPTSIESILGSHSVCQVLFNLDDPAAWQRSDVDLTYVLPPGPGPHQIAPEHHAALVAALDRNGRVAMLGTHDSALCEAIQTVLALVGGGHG